MTCLREAPSVRSVANSRVRWATVIERVLKITKRADEQRDAAEAEQHVADHRHAVVEVLRVVLGLRRRCP